MRYAWVVSRSDCLDARTLARREVEARVELLAERQAVRLCHLPGEGLTVDTYAGHLLLGDYRGLDVSTLDGLARAFADELASRSQPVHSAVVRARPDNLSHRRADRGPRQLIGRTPERWIIAEHAWKLEVSFTRAGFATGLFLDAYHGRRFVCAAASGRRVLNLFSYTGSFSVAAALGGAAQVIEVDTSRKWLAWARANQQLNAVTCIRQRRNDAVRFVQRQDDAAFDLIICDPPSYANPKKGRRFTIADGYKLMSGHFARLLRPGGLLLAMCNHAGTTPGQFCRWLGRELVFDRWLAVAEDFAGADHLKMAVLRRN
jgi:23S rRNA (cytosine1962-C5)-methyltransferase